MPAYNEKKTGSEKREADLRRALRDEKTGAVPEEIFVNFADTELFNSNPFSSQITHL